ncbi:MAG: Ribosomal RNA small subunit methyltransferase F [Verrucomicrobia subdivision 3 bacterium]|nr:Ribosomal RNA small subunit methyltransferase F [Limisphaerales bacterium]MCS1412325.1 Ribosomal RNA small subunit methyltransferase F [Limisphaerales bacterium]
MQNRGEILACDVASSRLQLVEENCERLGVGNVVCRLIDENKLPDFGCLFNCVLVDAPGSNTGVMRCRVDLRWHIKKLALERLGHSSRDCFARSRSL